MNGEIDEFLKAYLMMMGQRRIIFTTNYLLKNTLKFMDHKKTLPF
jgi:hypothetical protein